MIAYKLFILIYKTIKSREVFNAKKGVIPKTATWNMNSTTIYYRITNKILYVILIAIYRKYSLYGKVQYNPNLCLCTYIKIVIFYVGWCTYGCMHNNMHILLALNQNTCTISQNVFDQSLICRFIFFQPFHTTMKIFSK